MRRLSSIIFILFLFVSCKDNKCIIIQGKIEGCESGNLIIKELTNEPHAYSDSLQLHSKGKFRFLIPSVRPAFYTLSLNNGNPITFLLYPGQEINIEAKGPDISTSIQIEGSPESISVNELLKNRRETIEAIHSLIDSIYALAENENQKSLLEKYSHAISNLHQTHRKYSIDFIEKNKQSPISILALHQYLGENRPVFSMERDFSYFHSVDSILFSKFPESESVRFLHTQVESYRVLDKIPDVGKRVPSFSLPDTSGKMISLNDFKGNYVFLNFWASWDQEGRRNVWPIRSAYWKYYYKGLRMIHVSLDQTRNAWMKAIFNDRLLGVHCSDLKMWNSTVVPIFQLTKLPANYLINPEGVIIAKNIPADNLDIILSKIYGLQPGQVVYNKPKIDTTKKSIPINVSDTNSIP